jgi:hypothetical protein
MWDRHKMFSSSILFYHSSPPLLTPFIFISSFTQSINFFSRPTHRPCPSTFIVITLFVMTMNSIFVYQSSLNFITHIHFCHILSQSIYLFQGRPLPLHSSTFMFITLLVTCFSFLIHTYHSHLISEGVAEASLIFLQDALPKCTSYEEYCRRDRW